jgi:uncharacterized membrane protein
MVPFSHLLQTSRHFHFLQDEEHIMSQLVVIAFDNVDDAGKALESIRSGQHEGFISLQDSAVIVKEANGEVHVKNQVSKGTWMSTGVGGLLGILLAGIFAPVAGLALGLGGGALVGRLMDLGVDGKFVKETAESLQPNQSALFLLMKDGDPGAALAILRKYEGRVIHTNLSSEAEATLRDALGDKG